jgi:hypothetical protein
MNNIEEFKITIDCPWFSKLTDEFKQKIKSIFKGFGRPHPNGFVYAFHIRGWRELFEDVKWSYAEDEFEGPVIKITNVHCTRGQANSLMSEITHQHFADAFRQNRLEQPLKEMVKQYVPNTILLATVLPRGTLVGKYDSLKTKLPELEGVF